MRLLLPFLAPLFFSCTSQAKGPWETVTKDGHDYVTVRSVQKFYGFNTMKVRENNITLENDAVKCQLPLQGSAASLNNVRFHLEFPIIKNTVDDEDTYLLSRVTLSKTIDPVLRPHYIGKDPARSFSTIILDPDLMPAADDEDLTFNIAAAAKHTLEAKRFEVVLSRKKNERPALEERLAAHNNHEQALVVTLRTIEAPVEGLRTWILAPQGAPPFGEKFSEEKHLKKYRGNANDAMNVALATALHSTTLIKTGRPDRGIARSRDPLLARSKHPTVILECGSLSHATDAKHLRNQTFQQRLADSIATALFKARLATTRRAAAKKE